MSIFIKLIVATVFLLFFTSCKNKQSIVEKERKLCSLTIQLPFESSNYNGDGYNIGDTNFMLKDIAGQICIPSLDTVTKGGGTVTYDNLSYGGYTYIVKTIFNETITKTIQLVSDSTISLGAGDIYGFTDAITLDSLISSDSINIILSDTALFNTVTIKKAGGKYLIGFSDSKKKEQQGQVVKDSATTISALIELQVAMIGLRGMQIYNEPYSYMKYTPETAFYMKTGNEYMFCEEIKQQYFNKIQRQFIKAISK